MAEEMEDEEVGIPSHSNLSLILILLSYSSITFVVTPTLI